MIMPLVSSILATSLENNWLPREDGAWPDTESDSARILAGEIANWFSQAMAAGFPCSTATARKSQLEGQLTPAIQIGSASGAGQQIALAFMNYVAGQSFGSGVAAPPMATSAGGNLIGNALTQVDLDQSSRANMIASAFQMMSISSIVSFTTPPWAAPIT